MRGVNKVILLGHLGKDPEVRHLDGNNTVASFSLATSESYTTKDGNKVEQTEWHNIVMWRRLAEIAEKYLKKKGSLVYLEGRLRTRSWEDKDGNKKYTTEIIAGNMQMLDKRDDSQRSQSTTSGTSGGTTSASTENKTKDVVFEEPNDDLPF